MSTTVSGSILSLAWRNIWRHKRRTLLTISGIGFSAFLFVFVIPLQFGAYDTITDATLRTFLGYAQIQRPGYQQQPQIHNTIDGAEQLGKQIRRSGEFDAVAVRATGFALISSKDRSYGAQVAGVEIEYEQGVSIIPGKIVEGRYLGADNANELVVGAALARNLKIRLGDEITLLGTGKDGSIAATILPVVGIFKSGVDEFDRYMSQMPIKTFQQVFSMGDSAHNITVIGKNIQELEQVPLKLSRFISYTRDLVVVDWGELAPGIKEGLELDKVSGLLFMLILVIVVVFSIFNTFLMSVLERTKEFGLMLALGSRPSHISRLVMLESMLLTLLGLALGIIGGMALNLYFLDVGFMYPGVDEILEQYNMAFLDKIYPQITLFNIFFGPVVILIATNIAAWIPLARIHRLKPTEAMRTV
ncbi:MAG: FtsX-like permease family protein [Gammaproteobacteria bacterium]|nr:FtsX-like permease family protein [Gammaproteobacteria bacterium]